MPDIRIRRNHALGLHSARELARQWSARPGNEYAAAATGTLASGEAGDSVRFSRAGIDGTLVIAADHFELSATVGLLMAPFSGLIEAEMARTLDAMLAGGNTRASSGTA